MADSMMEADDINNINNYLHPNHHNITILSLRLSSRKRLGMYLDMEAIPLQNGLIPNYEGLSELMGFEFIEQMKFQRDKDHTMSLLAEWGNRPEMRPTLGRLVEYLLQLERFDVLEDCKEIIKFDAEHHLKKKAGTSEINPVQDATVSQSPFNIDEMEVDETAIITIQDVERGAPTFYDAFICYHPVGEDLDFVKTMIEKMECPPHNLKLFVPHRDDLPGASKHVISAKLIQDRCKRMVIVMSPRFLKSDACDFQIKFAHALSPGSRSKKLVPVLVESCETPTILRHVTMCDYTRGDMTGWFWDRLIKSLQAPLGEIHIEASNLSSIKMQIHSASAPDLTSPSRMSSSPAAAAAASAAGAGSNLSSTGLSSSPLSSGLSSSSPLTAGLSSSPLSSPGLSPSQNAHSSLTRPSAVGLSSSVGRHSPVTVPARFAGASSVEDSAPRRGSVTLPIAHGSNSSSEGGPSSPSAGRKAHKKNLKSRLRQVFSSYFYSEGSNA